MLMQALKEIGVISGSDMTVEAALTKLAYILGRTDFLLEEKRQASDRKLIFNIY